MSITALPPIVRFADLVAQPWANGAGVTRVLASGRLPGSVAEFDWRLSIADVTSGPFSTLPGIDRIITLVQGRHMQLTVDDLEIELDPCRPMRFSGDARTRCYTAEPTRDFNVMTRRAVCTANVSICLGSGFVAAPMGCITYLLAMRAPIDVRLTGTRPAVVLQRFDAIRLPRAAQVRVPSGGRSAIVRIRLQPKGSHN